MKSSTTTIRIDRKRIDLVEIISVLSWMREGTRDLDEMRFTFALLPNCIILSCKFLNFSIDSAMRLWSIIRLFRLETLGLAGLLLGVVMCAPARALDQIFQGRPSATSQVAADVS